MRDVKFRGKCQQGYDYSNGDGWVYGSLLQKDGSCAIVKTTDIDLSPKTDDGYSFVEDFGCIPVDPKTVGQFTGLYDSTKWEQLTKKEQGEFLVKRKANGKLNTSSDWKGYEMYEGDILKHDRHNIDSWKGIVEYKEGAFQIKPNGSQWYVLHEYRVLMVKIIGNILDNPELT